MGVEIDRLEVAVETNATNYIYISKLNMLPKSPHKIGKTSL